jgi:hypothetical protein
LRSAAATVVTTSTTTNTTTKSRGLPPFQCDHDETATASGRAVERKPTHAHQRRTRDWLLLSVCWAALLWKQRVKNVRRRQLEAVRQQTLRNAMDQAMAPPLPKMASMPQTLRWRQPPRSVRAGIAARRVAGSGKRGKNIAKQLCAFGGGRFRAGPSVRACTLARNALVGAPLAAYDWKICKCMAAVDLAIHEGRRRHGGPEESFRRMWSKTPACSSSR